MPINELTRRDVLAFTILSPSLVRGTGRAKHADEAAWQHMQQEAT